MNEQPLVGVRGFEPPASSSRTKRANRTAPHPAIKIRCKNNNTIEINNILSGQSDFIFTLHL